MAAQMEAGHSCPITMTHAAVAALLHEPVLARSLLPKLLARSYDPRFAPWQKKQAITVGMGMTERQGGTDVRAQHHHRHRDQRHRVRQGLRHHRP
jgi:putative acyl-CoA dehydrogenase